MKIEKIELNHMKMPLLNPFETSFGKMVDKDFLLVKVFSGEHVGYGESVALPTPTYNEETTGTISYTLKEFLIPMLLGATIEHPDEVSQLFAPIRRHNMAKSALEGAVWDLYAKKQKISLAEALGGQRDTIDVGVSIGIERSMDKLLHTVEGFLEAGYKKIKLKIKPGYDVEPLTKIRDTFGYDIPLMADANSAYTLNDISIFKELDKLKLMMIEQPLAHDDIVDHRHLQQQLVTPICLDESIHSFDDARRAIELGSCKIINIKIGRVGGLTEAKKIHDLCMKHQLPVWCGGMLEAGVGRAHNIALTSLENFTIAGDTSASNRYWAKDIITPEVILSGKGIISVPKGIGIGFELNEQVIEQYTFAEDKYSL